MIRIAYFFEYPSVSGAEGSALDLLGHLSSSQFAPVAFAPPSGELASRLDERGITRRTWRAPRRPIEETQLRDLLAQEGYDILHANTVQLGRLTGRIAGQCGAAGVAHIRAFGTLSARARRNLCQNEALIAVSQAVRAHLIQQGIPEGKIHVIYNGVSLPPAMGSPDVRRELGLTDDEALVVWLGQITVRKGLDVFLDVARQCLEHTGGVHFAVLGDLFGQKEENRAIKRGLMAELQAPPLCGRLHVLGWRRDALAVLKQATVLVHTARQEPLSRVLIEALAVGTPVIATAVGGTPEVLGPCGVLVEPGGAAAMALELSALLGDAERRTALSAAGVERWQRHFQAGRMAQEVADVWRGLRRDHKPYQRGGSGTSERKPFP